MNVLLIEPDKILGIAAVDTLETNGHKVTWCQSAQGALDTLEPALPDIIVLELQLGIHNGIEFLYELRSYPEWQHIPVIVHTINAHAIDGRFSDPFAQLGVQSVLYKPNTTSKQLARAVGQFVEV